ncbi:YlxR family protein [Vagococcus carniphilus]|uniref:YlxR family protein n=1 Tax=Vagococcus carniphilus TaxID=218144 RepID=A0AAW8U0Z2_9ENTE|nr:YlxR family protein [Vagococcus carniphilus]MDT2829485.1 YlxR family protein [Vagococcus carniphilus]MDT2833173.1 YlxR family protein [Vagococcus carniphilus]MDT2838944.1 YlxR family protein [Vagococcus carniphilus]MDT2847765.1 YlxR family protein [Vagococcus carniphilus]MDT2853002.1 YlxR family protein [Vagococcus carniphilus]
MKTRKIPMRKCVVSNEMKPKKEMIRIVRSKEGDVSIDPTGKLAGRGAYLSIEPEVVQLSWDNKTLDRILNTSLTDDFYQELLDYVTHQKARRELFSNDK